MKDVYVLGTMGESKLHGDSHYLLIGWQEWCALPELGIPAIKAKIDTGARTSAIHAFDIEPISKHGRKYVRFSVHPIQHNDLLAVTCEVPIVDRRRIMSSSGHKEFRYVIKTPIILGHKMWEIEVTLSNRDPLLFRMLLGREALQHGVMIEPHKRLCQGTRTKKELSKIYGEEVRIMKVKK